MSSIENWEKSDFKEVISEIVEDSDKSGYVTESKEVLIATVYENNKDDTYKATVKSEIDHVAKKYEQQNYKMEAVESDLDTRAKAQKEGISTGRYIRSHKDELEDKNKDDDNEDNKDDQNQGEDTGEKEKAVKEEDQPEQHMDDEESDTEDHPDGEKPSDQDHSQSDQEMEKEKESKSPNTENPQEHNHNDKDGQQSEEGTQRSGSGTNQESPKTPYQKEKKPSDQTNQQEYPPSGPGE